MLSQLVGKGAGKASLTVLACTVHGLARRCPSWCTGNAVDHDDFTRLLFDHCWNQGLGDINCALKVDINHSVHIVQARLGHWCWLEDACAVYQYIHPAKVV